MSDFAIHEHELLVPRTARFHVVGGGKHVNEVWIVLHGYGELARAFLAPFVPFADERRRIVAPEGLSRFYLRRTRGDVGASWMTSEARAAEIADQVTCLEAVRHEACRAHPAARVSVLGFSQGTATACRWIARTSFEVERLVLWGGAMPPDHEPAELERLRSIGVTLIIGDEDRYIDEDKVAREVRRLEEARVPNTLVRFAGGHALDQATLATLLP